MYKLCSLRKAVLFVIIVCAASLILVISKREYEAGLPIAIKKSENLKVYIYHNETEWINKTIPEVLGSLQSNESMDIVGKDVGEHAVETLTEVG